MALNWLKEMKIEAKNVIDCNVHDGEDRTGCNNDRASFSPDELRGLIDDLLDNLFNQE